MESSLIRVLPACLTEPLPSGWDQAPAEFTIEVMPGVERPEVVVLSLDTTEPDILLLDADFPDYDAFETTRQALAARSQLSVILMSSDSAPERLRQAMLAGVEEYLIKPLDARQLRDSLLNIAKHRELRQIVPEEREAVSGEANGVVIGVLSGKGGLGKTTLATNLAALVAKTAGKTAGLVALESGDGEVLLSLQPKLGLLDIAAGSGGQDNSIISASGRSIYSEEWIRQFGTKHASGLNYWGWQGSGTRGSAIPDDFLARLFEGFRYFQSVTVVDFPLLAPEEAATVLPLLDIILVVSSSSDLLALRSTKTFLDLVPPELEQRVRLIVNRADDSDMISPQDFQQNLGKKVAAEIPNQPDIAAQAINMGAPFVLTQPSSELATELQVLAQKLFKLPAAETSHKPKRRFMLF